MTAHLHDERVEGCYRCEISADEVTNMSAMSALDDVIYEYIRETALTPVSALYANQAIHHMLDAGHLIAADDVEGLLRALGATQIGFVDFAKQLHAKGDIPDWAMGHRLFALKADEWARSGNPVLWAMFKGEQA